MIAGGQLVDQDVTVADAVAMAVVDAGVDTVFGVGGTHTLPLLAALGRAGVRYVPARGELGAGYMGLGYARVAGRPAMVLTSTGPGALSVLPALQDAVWSSLPLLHVTTTVSGTGFSGTVHETPDQHEILRLGGKDAMTVGASTAAADVRRAVELTRTGPRGPVTVEVPVATWSEPTRPPTADTHAVGEHRPEPGLIDALVDALARATRPVVYVGGGAVRGDAGQAALALASRLGAPIVTSHPGKLVATWDHPLYIGPWATEPDVRDALRSADLAIVLGSKLSTLGTFAWQLRLPDTTFRVTLDERPHLHYPHLRTILGDASRTAEAVAAVVEQREPWLDVPALTQAVVARKRAEHPGELDFVDVLATRTAASRRFSGDMCKAAFWVMKYLAAEPRAVHAFSGYMAMGSGLPGAVGMAVASGEPVVALVGDGGLQMSLAELATMAELQLPITLLVVADGAYGILRDNAADPDVVLGLNLWNPDLPALLASYGMPVSSVSDPAELATALQHDIAGPRAIVTTQTFSRQW